MALTLTIVEESGLTVTDDRVVITVGASGPQGATGAAGVGVPAGGTTGQVLAKTSNTNYDTQWVAASSGSGDVVGPASSVDGRAVLFDGTTGKLIKQATAAPVLEGDARLTDARTPTAHAASHQDGGSDELALDASQTTTGQFDVARLGSGTPSASTFLRGDGSWQAPPGGTVDVVSNVASGRILGRTSSGSGDSEELTDANVRTFLGLATVATSGSASDLTTGTVGTARLGTGTATAGKYLRGDGTWAKNSGNLYFIDCSANDWIATWISTASVSSGSISGNANNSQASGVQWYPIFVPVRIGVAGLALEITQANAGANAIVRGALFNDNGSGAPGTSVAQATASIDTTGVKELTFSEVLIDPGWYWIGERYEALDTAGTNPARRNLAVIAPSAPTSTVPSGSAQMQAARTTGAITTATAIPDNPTITLGGVGGNTRAAFWLKVSTPA